MTQAQLAAAVGRSVSWVSQVERDLLVVDRIPVLKRLASALGVTQPELMRASNS